MKNKSKELEVAIKAALEAGKILEKYFETEIERNYKDDKSVVTLADREAEDKIKEIIIENFPNHSILGEETGLTQNKSEYIWHIDPLDGTTNFANGIPLFAVSIALEHEQKIITSVVYNPVTNNLFYTEKDKGAYFNNKKIFVSSDNESQCIVTIAAGKQKEKKDLERNLWYYLPEKIRSMRHFGCTALELSYVARGGIEANIQIGLHTYDFAAGALLVQEAGGKITTLDGGVWRFPDSYFIASNGVFHDLLVKEVKKQKEKFPPEADQP